MQLLTIILQQHIIFFNEKNQKGRLSNHCTIKGVNSSISSKTLLCYNLMHLKIIIGDPGLNLKIY